METRRSNKLVEICEQIGHPPKHFKTIVHFSTLGTRLYSIVSESRPFFDQILSVRMYNFLMTEIGFQQKKSKGDHRRKNFGSMYLLSITYSFLFSTSLRGFFCFIIFASIYSKKSYEMILVLHFESKKVALELLFVVSATKQDGVSRIFCDI